MYKVMKFFSRMHLMVIVHFFPAGIQHNAMMLSFQPGIMARLLMLLSVTFPKESAGCFFHLFHSVSTLKLTQILSLMK